jgi:hypothetical protein
MSNTQSKKEKEWKEKQFYAKLRRTTTHTSSREKEDAKTNQICGGITITTIGASHTRR